VSLTGYGIVARVDRGHLVLRDAVGSEQREGRFPRIGHGIKRLVIVGCDGLISLAALRWLHDQRAAFVMLERNGKVLTAAGPSRPRDSRLRRAQALAVQSGHAVLIARYLIDRKLSAQEHIARETLTNEHVAADIASARASLQTAEAIEAIRGVEARAALAYWSAWHQLPMAFPRSALRRVPEHWRTFGARRSPLSGSPRLAVNPANAMLNYLYAILESESRIAAVVVGLDPNLGFLHVDTDARASLACDLMEAVRQSVDAYVLKWIMNEPLRREWFFEERDGNCRLMGPFAAQLSETAEAWAHAVRPVAERVAAMLAETITTAGACVESSKTGRDNPPTIKRTSQTTLAPPSAPRVCRSCGGERRKGREQCLKCQNAALSALFPRILENARAKAHRPEAQTKRADALRRNMFACAAWKPSDSPVWLTPEAYVREIQPLLSSVKTSEIARTMTVSQSYAAQVRKGQRIPHPRQWLPLAQLVEASAAAPGRSRGTIRRWRSRGVTS